MRKGGITLWLCLMLAVFLTLIGSALCSARNAAGRTVFASAAEQGMFSLFSRYDSALFERFGLLALDGGYGSPDLRLGALREEAEEVAAYVTGNSGLPGGPANLTDLTPEKGEVTGYVLLTDQQGAALRTQIRRALEGKKTAAVLNEFRNLLAVRSSVWESLEKEAEAIDTAGTIEEYENLSSMTEEAEAVSRRAWQDMKTEEVQAVLCALSSPEAAGGNLPAAGENPAENPIESIRGIRKLSLLNLVLPKGTVVSDAGIEEDCVSRRTLKQGMGIVPVREESFVDKTLLLEYLVDFFPNFTSKEKGKGLQYQAEYAIGHKASDRENLKAVLNRLLAVREAANYLFLVKDPVKQQEVHAEALLISSLIGIPAGEPVVAEMLRFCWAFGESILDLRELLKGGKIPLMKDAGSWQLSIEGLAHLTEEQAGQHSSGNGLDYSWYLRLLLVSGKEEKLTWSVMDLLEHQMRTTEGKEGFRLDNCLTGMKICFRARQDGLFQLEAERSYNYDE